MILKKPKFWEHSSFSIWAFLLYPFSLIFIFLSYINKIKKSNKFPIPIICVGNINVGGTGKTPLATEIFRIVQSLGKKPAFIKKHYDYLNDEIKMLEEIGSTFVASNRKDAINSLIKNNNNLAILDDGFQDFTIKKNFSIVCFNEKQWIGNGLVMPSGPLRERLSAIKRANCIVINGKKNSNIEDQIYKNNKNAKIFYSKYVAINIDKFKNKKISAFAGIANPSNFFDLLKENNLNLTNTFYFPDHHNFSMSEINALLGSVIGSDKILLTTEKDYFRFTENSILKKNSIEYLKIRLEIENKDKFIDLLKKNI